MVLHDDVVAPCRDQSQQLGPIFVKGDAWRAESLPVPPLDVSEKSWPACQQVIAAESSRGSWLQQRGGSGCAASPGHQGARQKQQQQSVDFTPCCRDDMQHPGGSLAQRVADETQPCRNEEEGADSLSAASERGIAGWRDSGTAGRQLDTGGGSSPPFPFGLLAKNSPSTPGAAAAGRHEERNVAVAEEEAAAIPGTDAEAGADTAGTCPLVFPLVRPVQSHRLTAMDSGDWRRVAVGDSASGWPLNLVGQGAAATAAAAAPPAAPIRTPSGWQHRLSQGQCAAAAAAAAVPPVPISAASCGWQHRLSQPQQGKGGLPIRSTMQQQRGMPHQAAAGAAAAASSCTLAAASASPCTASCTPAATSAPSCISTSTSTPSSERQPQTVLGNQGRGRTLRVRTWSTPECPVGNGSFDDISDFSTDTSSIKAALAAAPQRGRPSDRASATAAAVPTGKPSHSPAAAASLSGDVRTLTLHGEPASRGTAAAAVPPGEPLDRPLKAAAALHGKPAERWAVPPGEPLDHLLEATASVLHGSPTTAPPAASHGPECDHHQLQQAHHTLEQQLLGQRPWPLSGLSAPAPAPRLRATAASASPAAAPREAAPLAPQETAPLAPQVSTVVSREKTSPVRISSSQSQRPLIGLPQPAPPLGACAASAQWSAAAPQEALIAPRAPQVPVVFKSETGRGGILPLLQAPIPTLQGSLPMSSPTHCRPAVQAPVPYCDDTKTLRPPDSALLPPDVKALQPRGNAAAPPPPHSDEAKTLQPPALMLPSDNAERRLPGRDAHVPPAAGVSELPPAAGVSEPPVASSVPSLTPAPLPAPSPPGQLPPPPDLDKRTINQTPPPPPGPPPPPPFSIPASSSRTTPPPPPGPPPPPPFSIPASSSRTTPPPPPPGPPPPPPVTPLSAAATPPPPPPLPRVSAASSPPPPGTRPAPPTPPLPGASAAGPSAHPSGLKRVNKVGRFLLSPICRSVLG